MNKKFKLFCIIPAILLLAILLIGWADSDSQIAQVKIQNETREIAFDTCPNCGKPCVHVSKELPLKAIFNFFERTVGKGCEQVNIPEEVTEYLLKLNLSIYYCPSCGNLEASIKPIILNIRKDKSKIIIEEKK